MGAPAPQRLPRLSQSVRDLSAEVIAGTNGRGPFATSAPEDLILVAGNFASYRLTMFPIIGHADLVAIRKFFLIPGTGLPILSLDAAGRAADRPFYVPADSFSRQSEGPSF